MYFTTSIERRLLSFLQGRRTQIKGVNRPLGDKLGDTHYTFIHGFTLERSWTNFSPCYCPCSFLSSLMTMLGPENHYSDGVNITRLGPVSCFYHYAMFEVTTLDLQVGLEQFGRANERLPLWHLHSGDNRLTTFHSHIHTPTAESAMQGDSQLVGSS